MCLVKIYVISLQASQRSFDGALHIRSGEPFHTGSHLHAELRGDDNLVAIATLLKPVADHRLGFAALISGHPLRIDVRGIDKIEAGSDKCVQQLKRSRLSHGPTKDVSAKRERSNFQFRVP